MGFITDYFWVFFLIGILAGIFVPFTSFFTPYILYLLMFVLFLSSLQIDLSSILTRIRDFKLVAYLVFLLLILIPLVFYFIFSPLLEPEYALSILILLVMPAGIAIPVYATLFKGSRSLGLVLSIITSLLAPFTVPVMIYLLSGVRTEVDFLQMFLGLALIIFVPFALSLLVRKYALRMVKRTEQYYAPLSILVIMCVMAGAIAKVDALALFDSSLVYPLFLLFLLAALLHLVGFYAVFRRRLKTRITSSLSAAYMNSTLAIILAAEFFGAKTLFLVVLYQIPTNLGLIAFGFIIKRYYTSRHA